MVIMMKIIVKSQVGEGMPLSYGSNQTFIVTTSLSLTVSMVVRLLSSSRLS